MYIQPPLAETDLSVLHEFVEANSFGIMVVVAADGTDANHIPFELSRDQGSLGTLKGHVSRGNPAWRLVSSNSTALVIFQGANAYISPSLHPARKTHGRVAPSWNYAAVHASGVVDVFEDEQWILNHLARLTRKHERDRSQPWDIAEAPTDFIRSAAKHVVGIQISIDHIVGKFQASQQYREDLRLSIIEGLFSEATDRTTEVALMMASRRSMHP